MATSWGSSAPRCGDCDSTTASCGGCAALTWSWPTTAGPEPAGALLLRGMLSGDQDLTWTDSATETVARMWRSFGGQLDHPRSCDWMLVLRPFRWARGLLAAAALRRTPVRELMPVRAVPLQALRPRSAPNAFPSPPADLRGEDATGAAIVPHLEDLTRGFRLRVDYDQPYLDQLFAQVESVMGPLVRRIVSRAGAPIGWYAYLCRPGGVSRVLHICAPEAEIEAVVGELIDDARRRGSAVLAGRSRAASIRPARTSPPGRCPARARWSTPATPRSTLCWRPAPRCSPSSTGSGS